MLVKATLGRALKKVLEGYSLLLSPSPTLCHPSKGGTIGHLSKEKNTFLGKLQM